MTKGTVTGINSNLLTIEVDGPVSQNEICYVDAGGERLMGEVIRVTGRRAYSQVFDSTRGLKTGAEAEFSGRLLEVELGPGILSRIYDGLQSDLEKKTGLFLKRGEYVEPLDTDVSIDFIPLARV